MHIYISTDDGQCVPLDSSSQLLIVWIGSCERSGVAGVETADEAACMTILCWGFWNCTPSGCGKCGEERCRVVIPVGLVPSKSDLK